MLVRDLQSTQTNHAEQCLQNATVSIPVKFCHCAFYIVGCKLAHATLNECSGRLTCCRTCSRPYCRSGNKQVSLVDKVAPSDGFHVSAHIVTHNQWPSAFACPPPLTGCAVPVPWNS